MSEPKPVKVTPVQKATFARLTAEHPDWVACVTTREGGLVWWGSSPYLRQALALEVKA